MIGQTQPSQRCGYGASRPWWRSGSRKRRAGGCRVGIVRSKSSVSLAELDPGDGAVLGQGKAADGGVGAASRPPALRRAPPSRRSGAGGRRRCGPSPRRRCPCCRGRRTCAGCGPRGRWPAAPRGRRRSASRAAVSRSAPRPAGRRWRRSQVSSGILLELVVGAAQLALGDEPAAGAGAPRGLSGEKRRRSPTPLKSCISPSAKKPAPTGCEAQLVAEPDLLGHRDHALSAGVITW